MMWKNFANSPKGEQLNFLLNHDNTGYKLSSCLSDLTAVQIHFMYICAKRQHEELQAIRNGHDPYKSSSESNSPANPLTITDHDSSDEIREKLALITRCVNGN